MACLYYRLKVVDHSSSEADTDSSDRGNVPSRAKRKIKKEIFKKSLRLSSDQIVSLSNTILFIQNIWANNHFLKKLFLTKGVDQLTYSLKSNLDFLPASL